MHKSINYFIGLLFYDHLLTFPGEVEFVWKRKFSAVTVLFIMNRYVALIKKVLLVVDSPRVQIRLISISLPASYAIWEPPLYGCGENIALDADQIAK
ncbi:hypothetical protein AcV5_002360 [Taiwanofungus camphoratus]|nr:hypothetical protein AcV5_002360 [Antrodia cinnamomea]